MSYGPVAELLEALILSWLPLTGLPLCIAPATLLAVWAGHCHGDQAAQGGGGTSRQGCAPGKPRVLQAVHRPIRSSAQWLLVDVAQVAGHGRTWS